MRAIEKPIFQPILSTVPVAIYTRVSTAGQVGGRFDSCESQAAICREYIAKHTGDGWHEVACFTDAAYSGATLNRPGLQALMRQIELGQIRVVLIFKLERVLRSTDEWAPFRTFLQKHDCRLVSTTEDPSEDTPSGRLKNNVLVSVAEYERLNTAQKVRAKMLAQVKRGFWNYGAVPFGYAYDEKTQTLAAHTTEADVVRRIFEQAARLVSLREIAEALNADGCRTRVRVYRTRDLALRQVGGRHFRTDALHAIIRNPIYLGKLRFQGEEYPGQHPALVTDETWEKANAVVTKVKRASPWLLRPGDKHFHLLKGIVFCAACGRAMVPHANGRRTAEGKRYRYYTCGHLYREREPAPCGIRHVSASGLERIVIGVLAEIHRHEAILNAAVESSRLRKRTDREPLRTRAAEVEKKLAAVGRQLRNCVDAIAVGADVLGAELRERAVALRDEKQTLLVQQEQVRQELFACDQDVLDGERVAASLTRFGEVFEKLEPAEKKALVRLCIERIELRRATARPTGELSPGIRVLDLRIKLPLVRLVDGMEQRLIVQHRGSDSAKGARTLLLNFVIALGNHGIATVLEPFVREFGSPCHRQAVAPPAPARHPIHRAIEWRKKFETRGRTTAGAFAKEIGVSRALLDFHWMLLRLAPDIQRGLKRMTDRAEIRQFGLMRMVRLAHRPLAAQLLAFSRWQAEWSARAAAKRP